MNTSSCWEQDAPIGKTAPTRTPDRQPGRSCAVPFLPGGWHSRLCGKKDGTIITSYFDEGVFGNYGWDEPLGACGLIAWTSEGTPLWKNENYSIYDCYAISLDEEENLWFYYYDEFRLVRTNFKEDFVFELPIEGSGAFSVAPSGNTFLFQGGYQQRDKFYFLTAHGDHLGQKQEAIPTCDGNKVAVEQCSLLRSRMLFLGKDGVLYGGIWGSDGQ
ncbi:MAG: hypothetical protein ACLRIT_12695 [Blautia sp.]